MSKRRASEVAIARGRLKGALQDIANVPEDDDDIDSNKPSRGRPPKRIKKDLTPPPQTSVQHSFLMKLFDRCVDLAKYNEDTPLYPICRAWMINQPRSNHIINYKVKKEPVTLKRESIPNLLGDLKSEKVTEVSAMPACESVAFPRAQSLLSFQKKGPQVDMDLHYDPENPSHERDELLVQMKERWNLIRNKWTAHSKEYNIKKYGTNLAILDALFLGNR